MNEMRISKTSKKRVISLIMTVSLILGLFAAVAIAADNDYDVTDTFEEVVVNTDENASDAQASEQGQETLPAEEVEVVEPDYEAQPEEDTVSNDEAYEESDSYTDDEYDYEDEEYEYAEYDIITITVVEGLYDDVDVVVAPYGTDYVYTIYEDEDGNLEVAITFPPTTEGDIEDENVTVPSDWDFDIESDVYGYTTVTVYGFVPLLDFNVGNLAELRALMESGQVEDGSVITLTATIVIPTGDSLDLSFNGANVTLLVNGTHHHFSVSGSLTIGSGVTLQGNQPDGFSWSTWPIAYDYHCGAVREHIVNTAAAWSRGGGVYLNHVDATLVMDAGSTITGNRANRGGAVLLLRGTFTMNSGAIIENNLADLTGGGVQLYGSGPDSVSTFIMNNGATIRNNVARYRGGAIDSVASTANPTSNNVRIYGGLIQGNVASEQGGGISLRNSTSLFLANAYITGNKTVRLGAALSVVTLSTTNAVSIVVDGGTVSGNVLLNASNNGGSGAFFGWYSTLAANGSYMNLQLLGDDSLRFGGYRDDPDVYHTTIWSDGTTIATRPTPLDMHRDPNTGAITINNSRIMSGFEYIKDVEIILPGGDIEINVPLGGQVVYIPSGNDNPARYIVRDGNGDIVDMGPRNDDGTYYDEDGNPWIVNPNYPGPGEDPWIPVDTTAEPGYPWRGTNTLEQYTVRNIIINIWGSYNRSGGHGLLRTHNVTGVEIPQILFDLVATDGWQAWFMANRVWEQGITASQFATPMSAAVAFSQNSLDWNNTNRIIGLDHFFSYLPIIVERAVYRFEDTGTLGYLAGIEPGIEAVVIGFAVEALNWDQITGDLAGPFSRVLQYVLAPVEYDVTFLLNDDTATVHATMTVVVGSTITPPALPTRADYTFRNWYTNAAATTAFNFGTPVTDDLTLYAGWTAGEPTEPVQQVFFWLNDGSGNLHYVANLEAGNTVTPPSVPTQTGYTFRGWYTSAATTTAFTFGTTITDTTNVYAAWTPGEPAQPVQQVFFWLNDGSGDLHHVAYVVGGTTVAPPPVPTRDGFYTLRNWYTSEAAITAFNFGTAITGTTNVFAGWEILEPGAPWRGTNTLEQYTVRNIIINIWGSYNRSGGHGLLRTHNVTGVEIPQVLFDLVDTDGWEDWFMTRRVWEPAITASQFTTPMSATAVFSASSLAWNDSGRITDLDHFFGYLGAIVDRAVYQFEATGTLGYLAGIEAGIEAVVIGFAVESRNWNQITDDLAGPFSRVLQHVLAPSAGAMVPCDEIPGGFRCPDGNLYFPNPDYPENSNDPFVGPMVPCDEIPGGFRCPDDNLYLPNPNYPGSSDNPIVGPMVPCDEIPGGFRCPDDNLYLPNPNYPGSSDNPIVGPMEPCDEIPGGLRCPDDNLYLPNPNYPGSSDNPIVGPMVPCDEIPGGLRCPDDNLFFPNPDYPDNSDNPIVGPMEPCDEIPGGFRCPDDILIIRNPDYPHNSDNPWVNTTRVIWGDVTGNGVAGTTGDLMLLLAYVANPTDSAIANQINRPEVYVLGIIGRAETTELMHLLAYVANPGSVVLGPQA